MLNNRDKALERRFWAPSRGEGEWPREVALGWGSNEVELLAHAAPCQTLTDLNLTVVPLQKEILALERTEKNLVAKLDRARSISASIIKDACLVERAWWQHRSLLHEVVGSTPSNQVALASLEAMRLMALDDFVNVDGGPWMVCNPTDEAMQVRAWSSSTLQSGVFSLNDEIKRVEILPSVDLEETSSRFVATGLPSDLVRKMFESDA